ncbi:MAG: 3-keto-5-aminohexanoate cleavage protein [Chloroflexi bacterium]|nr:3-keto-5-aminohexanoate cleavage protein [Chloroflexota bacterium]
MEKLIVSVATTGSWPTKQMTPYVPVTPEEIASSAIEAWREGASIVHIHVRDDAGNVVCDPARYRRAMELIRNAGCDIVLNLSTSGGAGGASEEDRLAVVDLHPDLASFDAGSMNFGERVFLNSPDFLARLARRMRGQGVKPEIECFDTGQIDNAVRIIGQDLIDPPYWFQIVLGVKGGASPSPRQLLHMVDMLPQGAPWSVCAVGRDQLPMNTVAIAMGGHARTGLEDNIYYRKGELAVSNAQLVARVVRIGREMGREIASPSEARAILGLPPTR